MSNTKPINSPIAIRRLNCREHKKEVKELWLELQSRYSIGFFVSWGWIDVWLRSLPADRDVDFIAVYRDQALIGGFCLGIVRSVQHGLFYKARAYLNESGDKEMDALTIEYNTALGPLDRDTWNCILSSDVLADIEEFYFTNITADAYDSINFDSALSIKFSDQKHSYLVDLDALRTSRQNYLDQLSTNKRSQVRKSLAYYGGVGEIKIEEAASVEEAKLFLAELMQLHQLRWRERGFSGAFASEYFVTFHHELIASRFATGEIQVLKFSNLNVCIGYLYNFVFGTDVYYYQSGFAYESSNAARPGLVCHYLAIEHNLARGMTNYNFLAGNAQYKRSLSTAQDNLYTVALVRNNYKWTLEKFLRRLKKSMSREK